MIENIFSIPIGFELLDVDCRIIEKICYDEKIKDPKGNKASNVFGWQSKSFNYENYEKNHEKLFLNKILLKLNEFSNQIGLNFNLNISNYWININSTNSYNITHTHPGSLLSGCLYIKVPKENCGSIIFENTNTELINSYMYHWHKKNSEFNNTFSTSWVHQPIESKCLIFPSWLRHSVEPNLSNDDRISISFNSGVI